jgi:hypothetical protein
MSTGESRRHNVLEFREPFCDLNQVAFFLDLSYHAAHVAWRSGRLPRARTIEGGEFAPTRKHLVAASALEPLLDPEGRRLFDSWQRGELDVPVAGRARRAIPIRTLARIPST